MNERILFCLHEMQDEAYRNFQRKLIPDIDPETIIGVRTPQLRALAKQLRGTEEAAAFLTALPHGTFEENQLHSFLIGQEKGFDTCLALVNNFLPFVNNWATCDQFAPKALTKDTDRLLASIQAWLASDHVYSIRFGVNCLMRWYLDDAFDPAYLKWVSALRSEEYYVNMGIAWYFATALAKQWDAAVPVIEGKVLDRWTHNRAIQKAIESNRLTEEQKAYLRTLRIR